MNDTATRYSVGYHMTEQGWCVLSSTGERVSPLRKRKAQAETDYYDRDANGVSWNTRNDDGVKAQIAADRSAANCCPACKEATDLTGQLGLTPFDGPFVGCATRQLVHNDVIRTPGNAPHILGDVSVQGKVTTVVWRDRTERESIGGHALRMIRTDELPKVRGAGLMPINGKLIEMEDNRTGIQQIKDLLTFDE